MHVYSECVPAPNMLNNCDDVAQALPIEGMIKYTALNQNELLEEYLADKSPGHAGEEHSSEFASTSQPRKALCLAFSLIFLALYC